MSVRSRTWKNAKGEENTAWVVDYKSLTGKRRLKTFKLKKAADAFLRQVQDELENRTHVARREQWTVREVWEDEDRGWKQESERRARREPTKRARVDNIEKVFRLHILPEWGAVPLTAITRESVQRWTDRILIGSESVPRVLHRQGRPYKVDTVKGWVAELSLMLDWAIHNQMGLRRNPLLEDLKGLPLDYPPDDARLPVPLEMEDAERVLLWTQRPRQLWQSPQTWGSTRIGVLIAMLAGLRPDLVDANGEVRNKLRIWRSYSSRYGIGPTKSRRERVVPTNPILHAALQAYHRWCGAPTEGPVLLDSDAKRLSPICLGSKFWPQVQVDIGLVDVRNGFKGQHKHRFHDLRHTAGSFWIIQNVPGETVSDWLGHRNYAFTKSVYIHQLQHDQRGTQALHRLSDYLVDRMAQRGMQLPASEPIKLIEPPKPPKPPEADQVQVVAPSCHPNRRRNGSPARDLTETEERIAELWHQGRYYLPDRQRDRGTAGDRGARAGGARPQGHPEEAVHKQVFRRAAHPGDRTDARDQPRRQRPLQHRKGQREDRLVDWSDQGAGATKPGWSGAADSRR